MFASIERTTRPTPRQARARETLPMDASEGPAAPCSSRRAAMLSVPPSIDGLLGLGLSTYNGAVPLQIRLEPGVHRLTSPLELRGNGTLHFVGRSASISGGVPLSNWTRRGNTSLWEAPLPADFNRTSIDGRMQMWRGQQRLTLARSPGRVYENASAFNITFKAGDIRPMYHDFDSVHLVLYESWTASMHTMTKVDPDKRVAYLATKYNARWARQAAGSRYYVENAIEELDEPDEFYVDVLGGVAVVHAAESDPNVGPPLVLANLNELVRIRGNASATAGSHSFEGITFEHTSVEGAFIRAGADGQSADFLEAAAVHVQHAHGVTVRNCTFRATGGYAVWAADGAYGFELSGSALHDLGAGAVRLGRGGAAKGVVESEGAIISDNVLRDGGHVWQMGVGVLAQQVANVSISHNEIDHFRYTGVSTGWTWGYGPTGVHDIRTEFNHIHHIGLGYLSDMGCVYTLGHQPRSRVVNNLCADVQSYHYGGWAYYTDEGSRDEAFTSNVAMRVKCAGHHQHYGTDNTLSNNLYYDVDIGDVPTPGRPHVLMAGFCDSAIRMSTHARNVAACHPHSAPTKGCCCAPGCDQGKCASMTFERNVVYLPARSNSTLVGATWAHGLDNSTFRQNVYFRNGRGPEAPLFNSTHFQSLRQLAAHKHGAPSGESFIDWQRTKDTGSIFADPLITSNVTFSLAPKSPALARGFVPIDVSKIGPRTALVGASGRQLEAISPQARSGRAIGALVAKGLLAR